GAVAKAGEPPSRAKGEPPMLLGPTLSGYSAAGVKQMAILMANDAGLPLSTGFDPRKPDELTAMIKRTTQALQGYPAFRGWSWSSNWWVFHERGAAAARTPQEQKAYHD